MKSAFIPYKERLHYIYDIIKPGFRESTGQLLSLKKYLQKNYEETIHKL
jgi:adenosine deaminase